MLSITAASLLMATLASCSSINLSENTAIGHNNRVTSVVDCGFHILYAGDNVEFKSHTSGTTYKSYSNCMWIFVSPDEISVECNIIKLQKSNNCVKDYLLLSNPSLASSQKYCNKSPTTVSFTSTMVSSIIHYVAASFVSDKKKNYQGFTCTVTVNSDSTHPITTEVTTAEPNQGDCPCGRDSQARIVGGTSTQPHQFPWQIGLKSTTADYNIIWCGASLLNEDYALTAAHCVDLYDDMWAVAGEHIYYPFGDPNNQFREVPPGTTYRMIHPNYQSPGANSHDVAVLKVASSFNLNVYVHPICMPRAYDNFIGQVATVTGWGAISEGGSLVDTLQMVDVNVFADNTCINQYQGSIDYYSDHMLCAGVVGGGKDSCQGDSGGPLVVPVNNLYVQGGVVSFGIGCARPDFYGVYAEIADPDILSFIESSSNNGLFYRDQCQ